MLTLRPYQQTAVDAVYKHLRERDDNPCVVLPTGTGKSLVIAKLVRDAVAQWNGRVLILAHVKELLEQNAGKIKILCPDIQIGIFSAGLKSRDTEESVIVAGIQSVYDKACDLGAFDLIIVDEAHLIAPDGDGMYRSFLKDMQIINPHVRLIGLTATPFRLKGGLICKPENLLNEVCYEAGLKEMFERYDRLFRGRGWKLIDGENGEKVLDMGNGVKVPATPETWEQAKGSINQKAAEALQVHANMSYAGTRGDPVKRAIASNVRALRPYNNGDMTGSYKAVQGWVSDSSEEEKTWFMFHQGLKDFRDSGVPMADKLEELGRCQQFLGKVGFTMEGLDLKNPNPESATFLELSTGRRMNFSEFEKFVESKDSLGTRIERRIAGEQWRSVSANGRRMMSSVQNGRKVKKDEAADVAESGATGAEARAISDGKAFVEKHGLEGSVSRIAEDCKSRKTAIKNEDDVYKAFDNARAEAEKVYLETDDYGKAREQFSQALEECGVSKELIPELWKDAELDDQIAKKTEQLKGMLRKDAAFAQGRAKYPKAARRKYSNKYEKGMLPREELAEEREALAKELNELEAQKRKRKEEREAALKQRAENKQKLMKFRGAK